MSSPLSTASVTAGSSLPTLRQSGPLGARVQALTVISLVLCGLIVAAAILVGILGRPSHTITEVTVVDESGVLDEVLAEEAITGLRTYEPTRVLVYARPGVYADNLNEKTLEFARDNPELDLFSPDERKWADGVFIISLNVENDGSNGSAGSGQVGTYFGEDIKLASTSEEQELQSEGYSYFQSRDWTGGVIAIADTAASTLAKPGYASAPFLVITSLILITMLLANVIIMRGAARVFGAGRAAFAAGTQNIHDLLSWVELIPEHGFGKRVKRTGATVLHDYNDMLSTRDRLDSTALPALIAVNVPLLMRLNRFRDDAKELDGAATMLSTAVTLYKQHDGWEQIWRAEVGDLRSDLQQAMDSQDIPRHVTSRALVKDLQAFCTTSLKRLDAVEAAGIAGGEDALDTGLDEIAEMRKQLADFMRHVTDSSVNPNFEAKAHDFVDKAIRKQSRSMRRYSGLTGYYDPPHYVMPAAFGAGYSTGRAQHRSYVKAQEQAASSSSGSSTTGYGGGGGGFSGSGSSSRF